MKWLFVFAAAVYGQSTDQTGSITGTVVDAVTRMPVKKAIVTGFPIVSQVQNQGPIGASTDAGGTFTIPNVGAGRYRLMFQQPNYPTGPRSGPVSKTVEVKAGESSSPVTVELIPGASLTGRIVDEDGDPLMNCNTQLHPLNHPEQGVGMTSGSNEDGVYRLYGIAPGKYIASAQCHQPVFQPRPLSVGPDPPPSKAYAMQYYRSATDFKSAQAVELSAGAEKSGVDFQMVPLPVTQIRGVIAPGSADWREGQINIMLVSSNPGMNTGAQIDRQKGAFEFRQVFAGSYTIVAFTNGDPENRIGGFQRIEVADKPLQVAFELKHGIEISGRVQIEGNQSTTNPLTNSQIQITLMPNGIGFIQQPPPAQVNNDGTFTIKGVLPGMWRIHANAASGFLKEAWLGSTDIMNTPTDFSSGGALRVVVSTNTATIRGTAPAQQAVMLQESGADPFAGGSRGTQVDRNGRYKFEGLAPGKYRLFASDGFGPMPDEGGQEVTVKENETVIVDIKSAQ